MIAHDVVPGSPEWKMCRIGLPTASQLHRIITPTGKPSSQADGYMHQLIAEQALGVPLDDVASGFMERGQILEAKAVSWYELQRDVTTTLIGGFVTRDDGRVGCSPDRLVGEDGMIEIKCPAAHTHIGYLLDKDGIGYRVQVQAQLWICEREWTDTVSYHPDMPPALVRQARDDKFIAAIADAVAQFCDALDEAKVKLMPFGLFPGFEQRELRVSA